MDRIRIKMTEEERDIIAHLIGNGVPVFRAFPAQGKEGGDSWDPDRKGPGIASGYEMPSGWQNTLPDPSVLDRWEPGDALCAVTGVAIDVVDIDLQNGGTLGALIEELGGRVPATYGEAQSPSGGTHLLIGLLGINKYTGFLPGIDIQAGLDTQGRGFIFLPPTWKRSKTTGRIEKGHWRTRPNISGLRLLGGSDHTGEALRNLIDSKRNRPKREAGPGELDGDPTPEQIRKARAVLAKSVEAMKEAEEGARNSTLISLLPVLIRFAFGDCLDLEAVREQMLDAAEVVGIEVWEFDQTWNNAEKYATRDGADRPVVSPLDDPGDVFADGYEGPEGGHESDGEAGEGPEAGGGPRSGAEGDEGPVPASGPTEAPINFAAPENLDDARMAKWVGMTALAGRWCWASGLGWMRWDGRRWRRKTDEALKEALRRVMIRCYNLVLQDPEADADTIKRYMPLLTAKKIRDVLSLMKGVLEVEAGLFDQQDDLLNCWNGVVDLRTGELKPHDPRYRLTKITKTEYKPGATHPMWEKALEAVDPAVQGYLRNRFGQGITGHPTPDDVMPICQGGGSNGKSTLLGSIATALGDHMVYIPEKVLRANPSEHPTELMTLRGARLAAIDETPEAAQLNVPRLKAMLGVAKMTARAMRQDFVTWDTTHSLVVMTNYTPKISETDHGTWRRLSLVKFIKTFPKDEAFRMALTQGRGGISEAVLAWVVGGAVDWYAAGGVMEEPPESVRADTQKWRAESDFVIAYAEERLEFDPESGVVGSELLDDFNDWLGRNNNKTWSARLFNSRFEEHDSMRGVERSIVKSPQGLADRNGNPLGNTKARRVWRGIRFKVDPSLE